MAWGMQPRGDLLDYEQYIDRQLDRIRARIRTTDALTAGLLLLAAAVAVLFLEVVFDHAVGLPIGLRRAVLWLGLVAGGAYAVARVVLPLARRVSGFYAARTIEAVEPRFKNSLINYLDLRRRPAETPSLAMAAIEAAAVENLARIDIDTVVDQGRLTRVAYTFSAIVALFCTYEQLASKSTFDSARRALLADVDRPTNTRLVNIRPGDDPELSRVAAGSDVTFAAEVWGARPDRVVLHHSVDGGRSYAAHELSPGANRYDPWQATLRNVQRNVDYYLTGGDASSPRYHLVVTLAPMVTSVSLEYDFPKYLDIPRRPDVEGGHVEAVEGTAVTIHARTNEPAGSANLTFVGAEARPIPMEVSSSDPRVLAGRFILRASGRYTINFRTIRGQSNPDPVVYDIIALPDSPPTASFLRPDEPEIEVPSDARVDLVMEASDDHGVADATLQVVRDGKSLLSKDLLDRRSPTSDFRGTEPLDLAAWSLEPGSEVAYRLVVRDNKEPRPNRFETPWQKLRVAGPLPPAKHGAADRRDRDARRQTEPPRPEPAKRSGDSDSRKVPDTSDRSGHVPELARGIEQLTGSNVGPNEAGAKERGEAPRIGEEGQLLPDEPPLTPERVGKLQRLQAALGLGRPRPDPALVGGPDNRGSANSAPREPSPVPLAGNRPLPLVQPPPAVPESREARAAVKPGDRSIAPPADPRPRAAENRERTLQEKGPGHHNPPREQARQAAEKSGHREVAPVPSRKDAAARPASRLDETPAERVPSARPAPSRSPGATSRAKPGQVQSPTAEKPSARRASEAHSASPRPKGEPVQSPGRQRKVGRGDRPEKANQPHGEKQGVGNESKGHHAGLGESKGQSGPKLSRPGRSTGPPSGGKKPAGQHAEGPSKGGTTPPSAGPPGQSGQKPPGTDSREHSRSQAQSLGKRGAATARSSSPPGLKPNQAHGHPNGAHGRSGKGGQGGSGEDSSGGGGSQAPGPIGDPTLVPGAPQMMPEPAAGTPAVGPMETIAPDLAQVALILQKVDDLMRQEQVTPEFSRKAGMSLEALAQFVKSFRRSPRPPSRAEREILVEPASGRSFPPESSHAERSPESSVGPRTMRDEGVEQDEIRGNLEGPLIPVPIELRGGFDAYKKSILRSKSTARDRTRMTVPWDPHKESPRNGAD